MSVPAMKRALVVIALLVAVVFGGGYLALSRWASSLPKGETIRLLATATILVDRVERTGSSVQEFQLQWIYEPQIGRTGAWRVAARGEAIKVDVPGEEPIYVLMSSSSDSGNYGPLLEAQCTVRDQGPEKQKESRVNLNRCALTKFPKAIRFEGSGDYDTAVAVYTAGESQNGYQFVSMTFEKTDDVVTRGQIPQLLFAPGRKSTRVPFGRFTEIAGNLEFSSETFW